MTRALYAVEAVPPPRGGRAHGQGEMVRVKGEDCWPCGNSLCGACAAAFHLKVGAERCDFTTPTGERCRFTLGHPGPPAAAPPEVPVHVCIPENASREVA